MLDAKYPAGIGAIYLHRLDEFLAEYEADLQSFHACSAVDPAAEYPAPGRTATEAHPVDLSEILDPPGEPAESTADAPDRPDDYHAAEETPAPPRDASALPVMPQHLWVEQRLADLARAILNRLEEPALPVTDQLGHQHKIDLISDWCEELADLVPLYQESLFRDAGFKLPKRRDHDAGA
jgi:hypothetical protein